MSFRSIAVLKETMRRSIQDRGSEEPRDRSNQRPYVRDTWQAPRSAGETTAVSIGFVVLALAVGFVIGFAVFAVMNISIWLTSLIWDGLGGAVNVSWFPLVTCTLGGLIIGLWTYFSGNRINGLEEVMREFKQTGTYNLHGPFKTVVSFLLPLIFGGSVGFEAGLTGIITAGCCWIRDKLKIAGLRVGAIADVTIAATLSAIFGAPLAGIVAGAESTPSDDAPTPPELDDSDEAHVLRPNAYDMRRSVKIVLYMAAAIGAFGGIALFSTLFATESGLPRFDAIQATGVDFLWTVPCLIAAYALTLLYHASDYGFARFAERLETSPFATIASPVIAGMVLGAMAMAFPYVLFPGETQSHELMGSWQTWTVVALVGTSLLKAIATPMCIRMGWMGGSFFPSIFAGVACGYGIAAMTGADPMLMVTVVTSAYLAGVTRKPLLSVAILALCFPLTGILWSGLAAVVGGALPVPRAWLQPKE